MKALMSDLRQAPPKEIGGSAVLRLKDYAAGTITVPELGVVGNTDLSGSNVLYFDMADGCSFIVRPSGTEPKIKVYILARGEDQAACDAKVAKYAAYAETLKR